MIDVLRTHKRLLWHVSQIALVMGSLFFLAYEIAQNWITLRETTVDLDWAYAVQAVVILMGAWTIIAVPSYLALRRHTSRVTYLQAALIFCVSQVVKYLPGGLWALPGRMVLYQRRYDIRATLALSLVLWETFALLAGAILVGLAALSAVPGLVLRAGWLGLAALSVVTIHLGGQSHRVRAWAIRVVPSLDRRLPDEYIGLTSGTLWLMVLATSIFWLVTGIGFHQLVIAVTHSSASVGWLDSIGIYALAWAVGFMIVFVPAGIGIREGALVLLLAPFVTDSEAVAIAIVARLWWTAAETTWIVVALIFSQSR